MLHKIRFLAFISFLLFAFMIHTDAKAEERSVIILESYEVLDGSVASGEIIKLSLNFANKSYETDANDVMLYAYNSSGEIYPVFGGTNPLYIGDLGAGQSFQKEVYLYVSDYLISNNYLRLNFKIAYNDSIAGEVSNTVYLSIPVMEECKLKLNLVDNPSSLERNKMGVISISYKNIGKIGIQNFGVRVEGNIEDKELKYNMDSLGVGIENKIDCYIKFLEVGDQKLNIEAFYTGEDGTEHILDTDMISLSVIESTDRITANDVTSSGKVYKGNMMQQSVIIFCSFLAILATILWKNKRVC